MDVREREYEVGVKGADTEVLETGYLLSCVAFYGVDSNKQLAFLCHVDGHARGIKRIVCDLKARSGGDLSGFDLYVTSGWNRPVRIGGALLLGLLVKSICREHSVVAAFGYAGVAYYFFGPFFLGYVQLWWHFRKVVQPRFLWRFRRRVTVSVNASKMVPESPRFENEAESLMSEARFGYRKESCCFAPIKRASDTQASVEAIARCRATAGLPLL